MTVSYSDYRRAWKQDGNLQQLPRDRRLDYCLRQTAFSAATGQITEKTRKQLENLAHRLYG